MLRKKKNSNTFFCFFKGLSNDDVGVARGTAFQKLRPGAGAGFETGDFVKKSQGGATVERLDGVCLFLAKAFSERRGFLNPLKSPKIPPHTNFK